MHNDRNVDIFKSYLDGLSYEDIAKEKNISGQSARKVVAFYIRVINYNGKEYSTHPLRIKTLRFADKAYLMKIITDYFEYGIGYSKHSWVGPLSTRAQKAILRHTNITNKAELRSAILSGDIKIGTKGGIQDLGKKTLLELMKFAELL